jgi:Uma2 family endonuclease
MSALPQEPIRMTEEQYLAFEQDALEKHSYYEAKVIEIPYSTSNHSLIITSTITSLFTQLRQRDCTVLAISMRLKVESSTFYTYPDINVVCGKGLFADKERYNLLNPCVIIEVISPHSDYHDRFIKFPEYRRIPSLKEVLFILDNEPVAEHYKRLESGKWEITDYEGLDTLVDLPSIECTLALEDVYEKVEFEED